MPSRHADKAFIGNSHTYMLGSYASGPMLNSVTRTRASSLPVRMNCARLAARPVWRADTPRHACSALTRAYQCRQQTCGRFPVEIVKNETHVSSRPRPHLQRHMARTGHGIGMATGSLQPAPHNTHKVCSARVTLLNHSFDDLIATAVSICVMRHR
eukprot:359660-Chlamydomonas_euryale.AAC.2